MLTLLSCRCQVCFIYKWRLKAVVGPFRVGNHTSSAVFRPRSVQADLMRQQISESGKRFPSCRCTREPTIETAIQHQVFPRVVVQRPQVADRIAPEKRLSEMPYFAGDSELPPKWV